MPPVGQIAEQSLGAVPSTETRPSLDTLDGFVRCPDCIDGPIPGCQWDYDHPTEWKWKTCPTCDGSGKVSTANAGHEPLSKAENRKDA